MGRGALTIGLMNDRSSTATRATAPPLILTEHFRQQLAGHANMFGLAPIRFFELTGAISRSGAENILNDSARCTPRSLCAVGLVASLVHCPPHLAVRDLKLLPVPTAVEIDLLDALAAEMPASVYQVFVARRKQELIESADFYTVAPHEPEAV